MEQPEQYYNKDNWPIENERPVMLRLASEVPIQQQTLLRIFIIGLSKVNHLLVFKIIQRSLMLASKNSNLDFVL